MSSHSARVLKLSLKARQDFIDILRYTGERWGEAQLKTYRDKIDQAFRSIARNPLVGHHRSDLPTTHMAYAVGSHLIIYRDVENAIGVVRILHQRMSLGKHL